MVPDVHRCSVKLTYRYQVLDDVHVWQRVNLSRLAEAGVDLVEAGECVSSIDVHRTGPTNTWLKQNKQHLLLTFNF